MRSFYVSPRRLRKDGECAARVLSAHYVRLSAMAYERKIYIRKSGKDAQMRADAMRSEQSAAARRRLRRRHWRHAC